MYRLFFWALFQLDHTHFDATMRDHFSEQRFEGDMILNM